MMRLNQLSGKAWVKLSKNVWITHKLLAWTHRVPLQLRATFLMNHPTRKPHSMSDRPLDDTRIKLIELFTHRNDVVFDPDVQAGDTLNAALFTHRKFIGIAENPAQCARLRKQSDVHYPDKKLTLLNHEQDTRVLDRIPPHSVNFLLTALPRFDFKRHAASYAVSLNDLENTIKMYSEKLKPRAYVAFIVSDQRYQGTYYCRHADIIVVCQKAGLTLKGLLNVIQDRGALRAYGYPSTYVPNIINQFVIIARLQR